MRYTQRRNTQRIEGLRELASSVRRLDLHVVCGPNLGQVGGEMSVIDILVTLFFAALCIDPSQPNAPERVRFILSEGRSTVALSSKGEEFCDDWQTAVASALFDSSKPASNVTSF